MAKYPGIIPTLAEIFKATDYVDWTNASKWDDLRSELRAALVELGADPAGTFATVKARLDAMLPHFNNRGNPAVYDWEEGDLTLDGGLHDLDLSGTVPAGTQAVALKILIRASVAGNNIRFTRKGDTNYINRSEAYTQVANLFVEQDITIGCDVNRKIVYRASAANWTRIIIVIKGWWK